jgi:hypothetical protein
MVSSETVFSQAIFQKTYGGSGDNQAYCIQQTSDGGYIITGKSTSLGIGWADILIIRTDAFGDTLWTKSLGGTGYEEINSVRETSDGGFIMAGTYLPPPSISYALLIKMDSVGTILWTKAYGNSFTQDAKCVQQTSDGGYILCGNAVVFGNTTNDCLLMKTDSTGSVLWSKYFGTTSSDFAYYVEQTTDGGFVFTGSNGFSATIVKTYDDGDLQWAKAFSGAMALSLHQTSDNGFAILGERGGLGSGGSDFFFSKTDSAGNHLWSYQYGGNNIDRGFSFFETTDGDFVLSGLLYNSILYQSILMKTDSAGSILWSKVFGASDLSHGGYVIPTSDGGYASIGKYDSTNNYIYFIKTDSSGFSGCNESDTVFAVSAGVNAGNINLMWGSFSIGYVIPVMSLVQTPSSFTVNTLCMSTGIHQAAAIDKNLIVSPNPSSGTFTITVADDGKKKVVEIINFYGKTVLDKIELFETTIINLSNHPPGIYFVKITDGMNGTCKKVVVTGD